MWLKKLVELQNSHSYKSLLFVIILLSNADMRLIFSPHAPISVKLL